MNNQLISDELRYQLLKELEKNPELSQRQLAKRIGLSLGKTNYCVRALIATGLVKVNNFAKSSSKLSYVYVLTPKGIAEKSAVTVRFLQAKQKQFEELEKEIFDLKKEAERNNS